MIALLEFAAKNSLDDFFADPILTVACVLLIVTSIGWIVVTRIIVRNMRIEQARRARRPARGRQRQGRDIWSAPP